MHSECTKFVPLKWYHVVLSDCSDCIMLQTEGGVGKKNVISLAQSKNG
jgi:hypothetical protein